MKHFKTGIIGCGTIFPMHAQSLIITPGVTVQAVCDIKRNLARKAAQKYKCKAYTNYKKMLAEEA